MVVGPLRAGWENSDQMQPLVGFLVVLFALWTRLHYGSSIYTKHLDRALCVETSWAGYQT